MIRRLHHAVAEAQRGRLPRREHPGLRLRPRHRRARGRGRLHLRRGDRAARLARGLPRPAPAEAAVPGDRGPVRLPDGGQQRRVDRQRALHPPVRAPPSSPRFGTEKSKGFGIFSLSGHVTTPGQYEAPLGITLRELLDLAGGIRAGHRLKFWTPGGSSTPLFTDEHLDVPLDYESVAAAGSMLGTRSLQLFDETTCVVRVVLRWIEFYEHESCGKCTPCREGSYWIVQLLHRWSAARAARPTWTSCSTSATTSPAARSARSATRSRPRSSRRSSTSGTSTSSTSGIGGCPFDPAASTLFALESA